MLKEQCPDKFIVFFLVHQPSFSCNFEQYCATVEELKTTQGNKKVHCNIKFNLLGLSLIHFLHFRIAETL